MRDSALPQLIRRPRRAAAALLGLGALSLGGGLSGAVAAPAFGSATAPGALTVAVRVAPAAGHPAQIFHVSYRRPASTGGSGVMRWHDSVLVSGPRRPRCVSSAQAAVPDGAVGTRAAVALNPRQWGGRWCRGTFTGGIVQSESMHCTPPQMCPMLVVRPRTIGRFRFRVS